MHTYDYIVLALVALMLAAAFATSPEGAPTIDRQWAPADIHLSGIYRSTAMLPEEHFPPH
jgi:hypothetical protein